MTPWLPLLDVSKLGDFDYERGSVVLEMGQSPSSQGRAPATKWFKIQRMTSPGICQGICQRKGISCSMWVTWQ